MSSFRVLLKMLVLPVCEEVTKKTPQVCGPSVSWPFLCLQLSAVRNTALDFWIFMFSVCLSYVVLWGVVHVCSIGFRRRNEIK